MNIVVCVRCYNEERNIERFLKGYDFADKIIISDGGSTDRSLEVINQLSTPKIHLYHFEEREVMDNGEIWNPDNSHINFVLNKGKELNPDWLIFDDMDDVPNYLLRQDARSILENATSPQINAFRLYMWGNEEYFPQMNGNFSPDHKSLWAWQPNKVNISADMNIRHGTILGVINNWQGLDIPYCLLHRSWMPDTIDRKVERYNRLGLPMNHPSDGTFGHYERLPEYAHE